MAESASRKAFIRGGFLSTAIQLVVASIVVGAAFSFIGMSPREFWSGIYDFTSGLIALIGDSFGEVLLNLGTYLLIGAAIVLPIWLVFRVFTLGRRK
jgi:hypothetical protein